MNVFKFILVIVATFLLISCATSNKQPSVNTGTDDATTKLAEAASSISQSLNDLNAMQKAASPPLNNKYLAYPTSSNLNELVSVDWSGPIEGLADRAAHVSGYTLRIIGVRPATPVLVTVSARNTPLSYVLRDANFQAGTKASLVVYPGIRVIELRYGHA